MQDFKGKIAVVTGGGNGIGRELVLQLVAAGCEVAVCDVSRAGLDDTLERANANNPHTRTLSGFVCDVAEEAQVQEFSRHVQVNHSTTHINLLINNAGINGGGSFVESPRQEWERTFNICWSGVYLVTRTFLPMLMNSAEGHLVNMSSANALRAVLGGHVPHTAYSSAKFAVRGFSEALIHDFRFNAPHLGVSVVMPGHTGTGILSNSMQILGYNQPADWTADEIQQARARWQIAGFEQAQQLSEEQVRRQGEKEIENMRELGLPASEAARVILEGVQNKRWRILIGEDTESLDRLVRESPETAYDPDFVDRWREATVHRAESE